MSEAGLLYWAEHAELGFTPGVCITDDGDTMELQCDDGTIVRMPKSKAQPVHRNSLLGVPNLLELGDYSMPALLHNVRVRYLNNEFYSSIGLPILISVNPYKSIPHLYNHKTKLQYMQAYSGVTATSTGGSAGAEDVPDRRFFISKPHLFATAQMTYTALIRNKQAQSIVISGESGAGKTEATKILLKYFSELESASLLKHNNTDPSKACLVSSSVGDCIERYILNSNPILESFGNAKTVRNDNSSRFGRFIQIYFDLVETHRIKCGRISHYLLEKCRLISLYEKERNFHIFYELALGGMTNPYYYKKLIEWQILPPSDDVPFPGAQANNSLNNFTLIDHLIDQFHTILGAVPDVWYLGNESSLFEELISCMLTVGFQQDEVDHVLSIIAALMHLSRLRFRAVDSPDASYTDGMPLSSIEDLEPLRAACRLLQIRNIPSITPADIRDPVLAFSDILLFKVLRNVETNGHAPQWIRTPRDPTHASQVRDSIVKEIYSRLFDWIIKRINKALMNRGAGTDYDFCPSSGVGSSSKYKWSARKSSGSFPSNGGGRSATPPIGLLDIYGFEVFEGRNSFEQLCINYANEKLQQHFNQHVLSLEQATYRKEAIDWSEILFTDNRDVIRALEEPPHGVFVILDDTRITEKSRDHLFLQEIDRRGIKPIVTLPARRDTTFIVKHYAGDVQYCAKGFVEKNVDKLEQQSSYFLAKASTKALIKELFQPHDSGESTPPSGYADDVMLRRNSLKATLGVEFRNQLNQLIASLTSTTPTYVRCIKPNGLKQPGLFNSKDVLRQLEYAGLLESIRIRNSGFGVRSTFHEFLDDYIILLRKQSASYKKQRQTQTTEQLKTLCVQVLHHAHLGDGGNGGPRRWQIGRSKIFMKEEVQTVLEQARSLRRVQSATALQAYARSMFAQRRYKIIKRSLRKIQAVIRGHVTRLWIRRYRAVRRLQTYWRYTLPVRRWFVGVKSKIRFLQIWWRFRLYKRTLRQLAPAAQLAAAPGPSMRHPNSMTIAQSTSLPAAVPSQTGWSEPHVSSLETVDDYAKYSEPASRAPHRRAAPAPPEPVRRKAMIPKKCESSEDELGRLYAARKKSLSKSSEFNYEHTIHLMFSELTTKLRKTEKENKKMRIEMAKLMNESNARGQELNKVCGEKAALELELEERDRAALTEIQSLGDQIELLQSKLCNLYSLNREVDNVLNDLKVASDRERGFPECDLVRDFASYVLGCCSRGLKVVGSAMRQFSAEHETLVAADTYSPRCRNTPPICFPEPSRASGQLSCRFSRAADDDPLPPPMRPARHYHRAPQRRNESVYDDSSSFGLDDQSASRARQSTRGGSYLRGTASAYKAAHNPYMTLGGKPLDGQWSINELGSHFEPADARRGAYR